MQMGTGPLRPSACWNFKGATPPTESSPLVAKPNGNPTHAGDGQADGIVVDGVRGIGSPVISGITPDNGISSADGITNTGAISVLGSAPSNDVITVYRNGAEVGQTIALLTDTWSFDETGTDLSDGRLTVHCDGH